MWVIWVRENIDIVWVIVEEIGVMKIFLKNKILIDIEVVVREEGDRVYKVMF